VDVRGREFDSQQAKSFLFSKTSNLAVGPFSLLFSGYQGSFPRVKQWECEGDHSPSYSGKVKNEWRYTSSPIRLLSMDMVSFTFCTFLINSLAHSGWCVSHACQHIRLHSAHLRVLHGASVNSGYFPSPIKYQHLNRVTYINPLALNDAAYASANCGHCCTPLLGVLHYYYYYELAWKKIWCYNLNWGFCRLQRQLYSRAKTSR
jgi:hypothetical protein